LCRNNPTRGHKDYLAILKLAARESETAVCSALERIFDSGEPATVVDVEKMVKEELRPRRESTGHVEPVNISVYDSLLSGNSETREVHHERV